MRVISRKVLRDFWARHPDAEGPLRLWLKEAKAAIWSNPAHVKARYASASILGNNRVVFNIGGNKYRLVVSVHYRSQCLFIRFVGVHSAYDRIDPETA